MERYINRFDDIFHRYGDDADEDNDKNIDFDNVSAINYQDNNGTHDDDDDNDDGTTFADILEENESEPIHQSILSNEEHTRTQNNELIPMYLSRAYGQFDRMLYPLLKKLSRKINIEDLRDFAHLLHRLKCNELEQALWNKYLQSGTGELIKQEHIHAVLIKESTELPTLQYWPEEMKLKMIEMNQITTKDDEHINQQTCLDFVHSLLLRYDQCMDSNRDRLSKMKHHLRHLMNDEIENTILNYVEQYGVNLYRIQIDGYHVDIEHNYKDELIIMEFLQESPNEDQEKFSQNLFELKYKLEKEKINVATLKQRIIYQHLPKSLKSIQVEDCFNLNTIDNIAVRHQLHERSEKILERMRSKAILIYLALAETKLNEYQELFDYELAHLDRPRYGKLTPTMTKILFQRFQNLEQHLLSIYNLRISSFRQSIDNNVELNLIKRSQHDLPMSNKNCSPTLIQNTNHHLTSRQIQYLNRGPSYVTPGQFHTLSKFSIVSNDIHLKQFSSLQKDMNDILIKNGIYPSVRTNFTKQLTELFQQSFQQPISDELKERILDEKQLIRSIRYQLKQENLFLARTANEQNTFYLGSLNDLKKKSKDYIENLSNYEFISMIYGKNTEQEHLNDISTLFNAQLDDLYEQRLIDREYVLKFYVDQSSNYKLPHLYFLPEHDLDTDISVQPRFTSFHRSPIQSLAKYLDGILRPLVENVCQSTITLNSHDFIQKLSYYWMQQPPYQSNIHFATFKIHDLTTTISYEAIQQSLTSFFKHPLICDRKQHSRLSNNAIIELTMLVLKNNFFIYENQVYRFTHGSPLNLPLTQLLIDICLHQWQWKLVEQCRLKDLFYTRFHHQGLMTWNESINDLKTIFDNLKEYIPGDIRMTVVISKSTHFLNCYLKNQDGHLYTRVHRDENKQQLFALPYFSGHPRLIYRQYYRFLMIRAIEYCQLLEDFENERRYIEVTYLANGYSLDFIEYLWKQLLKKFHLSPIIFDTLDTVKYDILRKEVNRQMKYEIKYSQERTEDRISIKNRKLIHLTYLYDWGSRCDFNRKFYELWLNLLRESLLLKKSELKVTLNSKHCYLSNTLLAYPATK